MSKYPNVKVSVCQRSYCLGSVRPHSVSSISATYFYSQFDYTPIGSSRVLSPSPHSQHKMRKCNGMAIAVIINGVNMFLYQNWPVNILALWTF